MSIANPAEQWCENTNIIAVDVTVVMGQRTNFSFNILTKVSQTEVSSSSVHYSKTLFGLFVSFAAIYGHLLVFDKGQHSLCVLVCRCKSILAWHYKTFSESVCVYTGRQTRYSWWRISTCLLTFACFWRRCEPLRTRTTNVRESSFSTSYGCAVWSQLKI